MQLEPRGRKCSETVPHYCNGLSGFTGTEQVACNFLNNEGHTEPCLDANCHKSEEECLSRAGTMRFQGEFYPSNMIYDAKANGGNADAYDPETINRLSQSLAGMKRLMNEQGCCKTGTYKAACASQELMQVVNKYSICKDPEQFNSTAYSPFHHSCRYEESCAAAVLGRGVCYNPTNPDDECRDGNCMYSAKDCSEHRPGFKFRPYTHADLAYLSFRSRANSQNCCNDRRVNDECDVGKDSFLVEPPMGMCKDMTLYTPDAAARAHCDYLNQLLPLRHTFYVGACGEMGVEDFEEKCRDGPCQASKEVCESMGYTFRPYTKEEIQATYAYSHADSHGKQCCGGNGDNVITYMSETKYIKDGSPAAPTPGSCSKDTCCGKGTAWKDGFGCIPTRRGMIDACKDARGKWGWTCEHEEACA